eukprot:Tbor_TRINITY_DN5760_c1_g1::TRINITY_DN5760_c1_g1_i1::g.20000::m.20000
MSIAAKQVIPKALPRILHQYVDNPRAFSFLQPYENRFPAIKFCNDVYNLAPLCKLLLSVVPLYGAISGAIPDERVDLNTSASLAFTGFVWAIYALIITPQNYGSRILAVINMGVFGANSYNCYRKKKWLDNNKV